MAKYSVNTGTSMGDLLGEVLRDLRAVPGDTSKNMRKELRSAGLKILVDARGRASWSSRIPGALAINVARKGAAQGIDIVGKTGKAPHLRLYEFGKGGKSKTFRAPLFGMRAASYHWYSHNTRPFIVPAIAAGAKEFREGVLIAATDAFKKAGFK